MINAVIFVIRYFSGTKLGIPGLIHAHGTAAESAIKNANLKQWIEKRRLFITYPYQFDGVIKATMKKKSVRNNP